MSRDYVKFRERVEHVKRNIVKNRGSRADLECLVRACSGSAGYLFSEGLLEMLSVTVVSDRLSGAEEVLARPMRRRAKQLTSLGAQMRTVAAHAERLANNEESNLDPWAKLMPGRLRSSKPNEEPVEWYSPGLLREMRLCADRAVFQAREFGFYTRRLIKRDRWLDVKILCDLVRRATGRPFFDVIARLLVDAYKTNGVDRTFSAEQLRKVCKRLPTL